MSATARRIFFMTGSFSRLLMNESKVYGTLDAAHQHEDEKYHNNQPEAA